MENNLKETKPNTDVTHSEYISNIDSFILEVIDKKLYSDIKKLDEIVKEDVSEITFLARNKFIYKNQEITLHKNIVDDTCPNDIEIYEGLENYIYAVDRIKIKIKVRNKIKKIIKDTKVDTTFFNVDIKYLFKEPILTKTPVFNAFISCTYVIAGFNNKSEIIFKTSKSDTRVSRTEIKDMSYSNLLLLNEKLNEI